MKRLILPLILLVMIAGFVLVSCKKDEYVDTYEEVTETEESVTTTTKPKTTTKVAPTWQAAPTTTTTKPTKATRATLPTKKVIPTLPTTAAPTTKIPEPPATSNDIENLPPVTAVPTPEESTQNTLGSGSEFELPTMPLEQSGLVGFLVDVLG